MVSTFLMGSQEVYDFIDDNPGVLMMDVGIYERSRTSFRQNPTASMAINSALQVDLTGQVCADSLGTKFWSGVGGQVDFVYGASLFEGRERRSSPCLRSPPRAYRRSLRCSILEPAS